MNKESLISKGKKLSNGLVYVINVFDLEPSGVIIQAYSQMDSKERILPISEKEVLFLINYYNLALFHHEWNKALYYLLHRYHTSNQYLIKHIHTDDHHHARYKAHLKQGCVFK